MKPVFQRAVAIIASPLVLALGLFFTQVQSGYAQAQVQSGANPSAVASDTEALEKELAAMAARISQLEALLKARTTGQPGAAAVPANTEAAAPVAPAPAAAQVATETVPAKPAKIEPFSDWDWTWLNGNPRNKDVAFDSKFFTPEIRADLTYTYDFNKPIDDSMGGSSELFRSNEVQLEQLGIGGDFHLDNVRARFMTQFGAYSTATIRNDPSPVKGPVESGRRKPLPGGSLRRVPPQRIARDQP